MRSLLIFLFFFSTIPGFSQTITPGGPVNFCAGGSVVLTASTGNSYQWQLNGAPITGASARSYTASQTGSYTVVITTGGNPATTPAVAVTVYSRPVVSVTPPATPTCSGKPVRFSTAVTGGTAPYTYAWTFQGGGTSNAASPDHIFNSMGCGTANFTASLVVTDANGCTGTYSGSVSILQAPDVQLADVNTISPFHNCYALPTPGNNDYRITLNNISPSQGCISTYEVDFGDGSAVRTGLTAGSFPLIHTYTKVGSFDLKIKATGANGCTGEKTYSVANQHMPSSGFFTPVEPFYCAPDTIKFIISNWAENSDGTRYTLIFGDGDTLRKTVPLKPDGTDDTVKHAYKVTTCPQESFTAKLLVENGCPMSSFKISNTPPFYKKPKAYFRAPESGCTNSRIRFNDSTTDAYFIPNCSRNFTRRWDFGDPASGANNTSTDLNPDHAYAQPGTYLVTYTTENGCGISTYTKSICITNPPVPAFSFPKDTVCIGSTVRVDNSSTLGTCPGTTYQWSVSYAAGYCGTAASWSYVNGTSASSTNPEFQLNAPGTYTFRLNVNGPCPTATFQKTVVVKQKPTVTLTRQGNSVCGQTTVCPTATFTNCGTQALSILWEFDNGLSGTSTNANPGCIPLPAGEHTIRLSVTGDCGTTIATDTFTNTNRPDLALPVPLVICEGENTGPLNLSSTTPGAGITWTNNNTSIGLPAGGSGNINGFVAANPTGSAITATITVVAALNNCTETKNFTITVNPLPDAPGTGPVNYCHNDAASPLTAGVDAGNTLQWYTSATGGTAITTAPVPSTATVGTTTYYVSQKNILTNCEGPRAAIVVTVSAIPVVSGAGKVDPARCNSATGSILLNGLLPSITYPVQYSKNGGSPISVLLTADGSGILRIDNLTQGIYSDIIVGLNGCSADTVGPFQLSDPNRPPAPIAGKDTILCANGNVFFNSTSSVAGVSFSWTGPAGFSSNIQSPALNNVSPGHSGDYFVTVSIKDCISDPARVTLLVHPRPEMPTVANSIFPCENDNILLGATTNFAGAVTWRWTGPNGFSSDEQNPTIPNASGIKEGSYQVWITSVLGDCVSPPAATEVEIIPLPVITSASSVNPIGCGASNGSIILYGLVPGSTYTVRYSRNNGPVVNILRIAQPDGTIIISGLPAGRYTGIAVTLGDCTSLAAPELELSDTPPFSVMAEADKVCEGSNLILRATVTAPGSATWLWTGPNGFSSTSPSPVIRNASANHDGVYIVAVTINGCTARDTLAVAVSTYSIGGEVSGNATVCRAQNNGTLTLHNYHGDIVRWETSVNNGLSWTSVASSSPFLNYSNISLTTWYRVVVQSGVCPPAFSDTAVITIVPGIDAITMNTLPVKTCVRDTTISFTADVVYTGNDPLNYFWYVNGKVEGRNADFTHEFSSPANNANDQVFTVWLVVENVNGCHATSLTRQITIHALPLPMVQVHPGPIQYEPNFTFTFSDISTGGQNRTYTWNVGDTVSPPKTGKEVTHQYKRTGSYLVYLAVYDAITTCAAKDSVRVMIIPVPGGLSFPNAFYPNSVVPEIKTFKVKGIGIKEYHLQIFDGAGKLVFETKELNADGSPKVAWNGLYMNNGPPLPQDAYVWKIVKIEFIRGGRWDGAAFNGGSPKLYGSVTLIR